MRLSALKGRIRTIPITVGDGPEDVVNVTYRPGELTLEVADKIKEATEAGWEIDVVRIMLQPVLVEWDLVDDVLDDDGEPTGETVPLNVKDGLGVVPIDFLTLVLEGIQKDSRPNASKEETSDVTSPRTDGLGESLSGTT